MRYNDFPDTLNDKERFQTFNMSLACLLTFLSFYFFLMIILFFIIVIPDNSVFSFGLSS